jgi:hypothetical protein
VSNMVLPSLSINNFLTCPLKFGEIFWGLYEIFFF